MDIKQDSAADLRKLVDDGALERIWKEIREAASYGYYQADIQTLSDVRYLLSPTHQEDFRALGFEVTEHQQSFSGSIYFEISWGPK